MEIHSAPLGAVFARAGAGHLEFFFTSRITIRWIGTLTKRLGKFQMVHDVFSGRAAASAEIRSGATKIIFGIYHNCPWLPQKKGVWYFVFSDATI